MPDIGAHSCKPVSCDLVFRATHMQGMIAVMRTSRTPAGIWPPKPASTARLGTKAAATLK